MGDILFQYKPSGQTGRPWLDLTDGTTDEVEAVHRRGASSRMVVGHSKVMESSLPPMPTIQPAQTSSSTQGPVVGTSPWGDTFVLPDNGSSRPPRLSFSFELRPSVNPQRGSPLPVEPVTPSTTSETSDFLGFAPSLSTGSSSDVGEPFSLCSTESSPSCLLSQFASRLSPLLPPSPRRHSADNPSPTSSVCSSVNRNPSPSPSTNTPWDRRSLRSHSFSPGMPPGPAARLATYEQVDDADMYAFCPLAVSSSCRTPRRSTSCPGSPSLRRAELKPLKLGPLISAMEDGDEAGIRDAAQSVREDVKDCVENKQWLLRSGGVQILVDLLRSSKDAETVEHAVTVLFNVCRGDAGRTEIVSVAKNGLEAVVKSLEAGSAAARENAAAMIFCLLSKPQGSCGSGVMSAVGVPPGLPTSGSTKDLTALQLSASETQDKEIRRRFCEAGAIPLLVNILSSGSPRGRRDAALALCAVLSGSNRMDEFLDSGAVDMLLGFLHTAADEGLEEKAMALLALVAKHPAGRAAIKGSKVTTEGGLQLIVDLLELSGSQRARQDAVAALLLFASNDEDARSMLGREGVVPALYRVSRESAGRAGVKATALLGLLRPKTPAG